jgi:DNA polymerase-3 subunit alpha/error-prone DNA polymerase
MMFKEQLGETYGVMVYQEDVIKISFTLRRLPAAAGIFCAAWRRSKAALQKS